MRWNDSENTRLLDCLDLERDFAAGGGNLHFVTALVTQKRRADRAFCRELAITRVGFGSADDDIDFVYVAANLLYRNLGADTDSIGRAVIGGNLSAAKHILKVLDTAFGKAELFLCVVVVGIFFEIAIFDGFLQAARKIRATYRNQFIQFAAQTVRAVGGQDYIVVHYGASRIGWYLRLIVVPRQRNYNAIPPTHRWNVWQMRCDVKLYYTFGNRKEGFLMMIRDLRRTTQFLTSLFVVLVLGLSQAQGQPTFRIGVLDGPNGSLTTGATLAMNQINAAGGIRGADGQNYQLVAVAQGPDVFGSLSTAISNLSNAGVTAIIGPIDGASVEANIGALLALNVPILTPAIGDTLLANDTSDMIFRTRAAERLLGQALAEIIVRDFNITDIQTVVLDATGTGGQVGFSLAARDLGRQLGAATIFDPSRENINGLVQRVMQRPPQAVVIYGEATLANEFYIGLKNARFGGIVSYGGTDDPAFRAGLTPDQVEGIISAQSWSFALTDVASSEFVLDFARATGNVPRTLEAAGYDSVLLIAAALQRPDTLQNSLLALSGIQGTQGILAPARLPTGETSDNTAVVQYLGLGGSQVLARFAGGIRVQNQGEENRPPVVISTPTPRPTNTPVPTPTLDGVYATVVSQALNVRTGPSTIYDVLGQLRNAEQVRLIGTSLDGQWGVINFRGLQGWISLAPNLASVIGDLRTLPVVATPPTPTPGPTSTPAPTATLSTADIVIVGAAPSVLTWNTLNNVSVSVLNGGGVQSGQFAVAASFDPGGIFSGVTVSSPGLGAGQSTVINLPVTLTGTTGFYSTTIVADLNNEVNEGSGEANNGAFLFNYKLDHGTASAGQITLNSGLGINLDGVGGDDLVFNNGNMSAPGACNPNVASCIGALTVGLNFDTAHFDAITAANGVTLNAIGLAFGQTVGFITDGGKRGVLRIDAVSAGSVTFSYRVYLP